MGLSQALGAVPLLSLSLRSPFLSESTKSQEKYAWNEGLGRSCAWKRLAVCNLSYPSLDCLLSWASLRAGDVGGVPTPVTKTQAWGGCGALAMAPASVWVVSRRLLRTSF